jgi:predicted DNA-binding transcriptional regulator AlpA
VITELAELPKDTLLDETALARVLRINKRTVRRMVSRFELPPPVRFGGRSTWQAGRILAHFSKAAERAEKRARKIFAQIDKIA